MTITSEINKLKQAKHQIRLALEAKGTGITAQSLFNTYPSYILSMGALPDGKNSGLLDYAEDGTSNYYVIPSFYTISGKPIISSDSKVTGLNTSSITIPYWDVNNAWSYEMEFKRGDGTTAGWYFNNTHFGLYLHAAFNIVTLTICTNNEGTLFDCPDINVSTGSYTGTDVLKMIVTFDGVDKYSFTLYKNGTLVNTTNYTNAQKLWVPESGLLTLRSNFAGFEINLSSIKITSKTVNFDGSASPVSAIRDYAFYDYTTLENLVLTGPSVIPLNGTNALTGTPIANGTGNIYVPANLVDSYKTAANWSTYAARITSGTPETETQKVMIEHLESANRTVEFVGGLTLEELQGLEF